MLLCMIDILKFELMVLCRYDKESQLSKESNLKELLQREAKCCLLLIRGCIFRVKFSLKQS